MADIIEFDKAKMEAMARAFGDSAGVLEDIAGEVASIAAMLSDGALIGDAGEAFSAACREPLNKAISGLKEKFIEVQDDILRVIEDVERQDEAVGGSMRD